MQRIALIATVALTLAVAGCGNARTSKGASTVSATAICLRNAAPLKRNIEQAIASSAAQRAAIAGCACIACIAARGRIDVAPVLTRSLLQAQLEAPVTPNPPLVLVP